MYTLRSYIYYGIVHESILTKSVKLTCVFIINKPSSITQKRKTSLSFNYSLLFRLTFDTLDMS